MAPSVTHRQPAVVVAVQPLDDVGQRPVVLRARDNSVAVLIQHWKARTVSGPVVSCQTPANSLRLRLPSLSPSGRMTVLAHLVDLRLAEFTVTVVLVADDYRDIREPLARDLKKHDELHVTMADS